MTGKHSLPASLRGGSLSPRFAVCFVDSRLCSSPVKLPLPAPPHPGKAPPLALAAFLAALDAACPRTCSGGLSVLASFASVVFPRLVCTVASVSVSLLFTTK